jgi:hypothetical protein
MNSFVERRKISKHQAGKKDYRHIHASAPKQKRALIPTNHERVVAGRIKKNPDYLKGELK